MLLNDLFLIHRNILFFLMNRRKLFKEFNAVKQGILNLYIGFQVLVNRSMTSAEYAEMLSTIIGT